MTSPEPPEHRLRKPISPLKRYLLRGLGIVMVALGAVGLFLPLMPTTIFLLIALWAFTASAPEWAERLRRHPRVGPPLIAWEERQAIPTSAKLTAGLTMGVSWTALALFQRNLWVVGGVGLVLLVVFAYVVTRPSA